jgi:hypothetical protein
MGLGSFRFPKEISKWGSFIPSPLFIRKHSCCWSTRVYKGKGLINEKREILRLKGESWQDDRGDTRDGLWIGETLR